MFTSDPEGLLNLLTGSEQSGTLTLEPPETHAWQVRFTLVRGQLTNCVMKTATAPSVKVEPEKAMQELRKYRSLQWELAQSEKAPPKSNPTDEWQLMDRPYRMKANPSLSDLSDRLQRSIFNLVDGQRTVKGIAELLNNVSSG